MPDEKRTDKLDWQDLRFFVALARQGSLSAAARVLQVNHATVSRRIGSLEATLGRSLFDRRATGYALTAEGRAVLDEANVMDEAALAMLRRIDRSTELQGRVRVTTARVLADGFLVERLGALRLRYPALDLEIVAESRLASLPKREADIALRLGQPKDSDLRARRVGKIAFGFYASPTCRDRLAEGHPLTFIGYDDDSDFVSEAAWMADAFSDHRFSFRSNSQTSQAAAARAGFGVALLPHYLAVSDPCLVPIPLDRHPPDRELWLLIRSDLTKVPRIRAVADYLIDLIGKERPLLEG